MLNDIKKDVRDLIQNEIRQKINLYSQDEHQTLVDKRIIANLEKEIHFRKTEIETKNEIIKNFIKNDSHRDENYNVPQDGQFWEFTRMSSDSDTNKINTVNRNIDEQLKAIREEKHKEYLQNTSRKSPSQENIVIETNEKNDRDKTNGQPNNTHDNNEVKNEQDERDNQFYWPSGTCAIVGDSIQWSMESMENGYHKIIVTLKFFISRVQELKILIIISCQSSKTNQIT